MSKSSDLPPHDLEREFYARLRSEPELFHFLEQGSLDGIWYWDLENRDREWMSPRFWTLLGYDPAEKHHRSSEWQAVIFAEDLEIALENLQAHLRDPARPYDQIVRYRHKDGSTVWVRCRGIAIRDDAGRPIRMLGAHNDVTALKRAEGRLHQLNVDLEGRVAERTTDLERAHRESLALQERLQQAQRLESLAALAGGVAHDFNNLLTMILGNARLALEEVPSDSPARRRLERVREAGQHAARLTEQLLTYAGRGTADLEPTNLSSVVEGVEDLIRAVVDGLGVLELRLAADLPAIAGDATQLRQVLLNLVSNACEAFGARQGTVRVTTDLVQADEELLAACVGSPDPTPGPWVLLEVSDTGRGMDPEECSRLFEPFYTTKGEGRGLGLAVVLGIVTRHGGGLNVAPAPGGGTTFSVLFPLAPPSLANAVSSADGESIGTPVALVVDDKQEVAEIAEAFLTRAGFRVLTASGGRKAIEILRAEPQAIDAVVLDLAMPEMNGEVTFRELRRLKPGLPIVLCSGFSEELAASRFGLEGGPCFLRKPYQAEDLVSKVRQVMAERPAPAPRRYST